MTMPVHTWDDLERFANVLGEGQAEEQSHIRSPLGVAKAYRFDTPRLCGRVEFFSFGDDMRVLVFDSEWHQEHTICVRDEDWIRFNFSLSISMDMIPSGGRRITIASPSWRVIKYPDETVVEEAIPAGATTVWVTVACKPQCLKDVSGYDLEDLPELLGREKSVQSASFYEDFDITERLGRISSDIIRTNLNDQLRISYVQARATELICLATNEIVNPRTVPTNVRLSDRDRGAILEAKSLLDDAYSAPPNVQELSRQVGLNRNKLYYGFRALFDCTITEYIQAVRLEKAKQLIETTDDSLAAISRTVGFNHQCNFSTAFRRRFGETPSRCRQDKVGS